MTAERTSPLDYIKARFTAASVAPVLGIKALPYVAQMNLRGDTADAAFHEGVQRALGLSLPEANRYTGGTECSTLWLGPDEWLVVADDARREALLASLEENLKDVHHAAVDVSSNRTVIELSGTDARLMLAKGCPLALHTAAFAPPQVAQSVLAKAQVILQCVSSDPVFRIYVRNSYAAYLAEWLLDAAAECTAARSLDTQRVATRLN